MKSKGKDNQKMHYSSAIWFRYYQARYKKGIPPNHKKKTTQTQKKKKNKHAWGKRNVVFPQKGIVMITKGKILVFRNDFI